MRKEEKKLGELKGVNIGNWWKGRTKIKRRKYTHTHTHIYIYIYIYNEGDNSMKMLAWLNKMKRDRMNEM